MRQDQSLTVNPGIRVIAYRLYEASGPRLIPWGRNIKVATHWGGANPDPPIDGDPRKHSLSSHLELPND